MFFNIEGQVADGEFLRLMELLQLLDDRLLLIAGDIDKSLDSDGEGLLDRAEYLIGVGFVAMQQYVHEALIGLNIKRMDALRLGPFHGSGAPYIKIINESANWWKHEPEWFKKMACQDSTASLILDLVGACDYPMSNVLALINQGQPLSLGAASSKIMDWRDNIKA